MFDLHGKTALVTGSSRGIGRAIACELARQGYAVGINYIQSADKAAEKTVKEKKDSGKRKLTYKEQKELEQIEKDLEALAAEKAELEDALSSGSLPFDKLQEASERIGQIIEETDEKEMRWLELSE